MRISINTGWAVLLSLILPLLITRIIITSMNLRMRFGQPVVAGNLNDILTVSSRDEIGKLANALRSMAASLIGDMKRG